VIFWAAWCADSTRAIKEINKEYEAYKKSGVEVLTVAIDKDAKAITNFTKIQKIALPVVQDADKKLQAGYGITMVPATYIVDTKGKVAVYHKDYPGNRKLLEEIKALK
jgi:alkyl hydroperoxide reductase subunit AhpC